MPTPADPLAALTPPCAYVPSFEPVSIWGLPILPVTLSEAVDEVDRLIETRQPGYFITANLNYCMLANQDPDLYSVSEDAAFILADGMPLVWYAGLMRRPLPERVAGSDMIYKLCQRAAEKGHRVFFLGGAPGVAEEAVGKLCQLYPGLTIAGVEVPPFREMKPAETVRMIQRIRQAEPDLLFVALGQPKGELWIHQHYQALGVPACVQLGASFDFVTGRVRRAPRWLQKTGLEWLYRIYSEPRRMLPRYLANAWFLLRALCRRWN